MPTELESLIMQAVGQAASAYERLVLVVGPPGSGKTAALRAVHTRDGYPYLNVNLALSQALLDVPVSRQPFETPDLLDDLLAEAAPDTPMLLDNLELLFDPSLQLHPLNWLRRIARARTMVASWTGRFEHGFVTYAEPGHPEYRREPVGDLIVVPSAPPA